jgi:hypothetical protein
MKNRKTGTERERKRGWGEGDGIRIDVVHMK